MSQMLKSGKPTGEKFLPERHQMLEVQRHYQLVNVIYQNGIGVVPVVWRLSPMVIWHTLPHLYLISLSLKLDLVPG